MYDQEHAIIRMLRNGARGFILKDIDPKEFKQALNTLLQTGYYYSGLVSGKIIHAINNMDKASETMQVLSKLNDPEIRFLKLACTELTYKEIASEMKVTPRTVDGYREELFQKLSVHSRVGLVLFAIRNGLVNIG
jgi:DNA-binding NarL/FixJ family response regulator